MFNIYFGYFGSLCFVVMCININIRSIRSQASRSQSSAARGLARRGGDGGTIATLVVEICHN